MCHRFQKPEKVAGKKRGLEVFRQGDAHHQRGGAGGVGIAGKVEIQVEGVGHGAEHQHPAAVVMIVGKDLLHTSTDSVLPTAMALKVPSA